MAPVKRSATYRDIEALPEHRVGEILEGELVVSPRPAFAHAWIAMRLAENLTPFNCPGGEGPRAPGGWWILFEPELHLGRDVVVPDLAGWRRARMPKLPKVASCKQAPDWACEILSAGTMRVDRGKKMRIYARESVGHVWHIDPDARILEVCRLAAQKKWLLLDTYEGSAKIRAEPFQAVEIDLSQWWLD